MGSPLQNYEGPGEVYVNARLSAECVRVTVRNSANSNDVNTMARGLAGRSRGAAKAEITLENAVPKKGFENDFLGKYQAGDYISVVVKSGGKRMEYSVWVEDHELSNAVDQAASESVTLPGKLMGIR